MTNSISMREKIKILSELNAALECEELTAEISGRPSGELLYEVFKKSVLKEIEAIFSTQNNAESEKIAKASSALDEVLSKIEDIKGKVSELSTKPQPPVQQQAPQSVASPQEQLPVQRVASLPHRGGSFFS